MLMFLLLLLLAPHVRYIDTRNQNIIYCRSCPAAILSDVTIECGWRFTIGFSKRYAIFPAHACCMLAIGYWVSIPSSRLKYELSTLDSKEYVHILLLKILYIVLYYV